MTLTPRANFYFTQNCAAVITHKHLTALNLKLKLNFTFNAEWSKLSHKMTIFKDVLKTLTNI